MFFKEAHFPVLDTHSTEYPLWSPGGRVAELLPQPFLAQTLNGFSQYHGWPGGSKTGLANSTWFMITASLVFAFPDDITDKRITTCFKTRKTLFVKVSHILLYSFPVEVSGRSHLQVPLPSLLWVS